MRLPTGIVVAMLVVPLAGPDWSNFMQELNEAVGLAREQERQQGGEAREDDDKQHKRPSLNTNALPAQPEAPAEPEPETDMDDNR